MFNKKPKQSVSQAIKIRARKSLSASFSQGKKNYVVDSSVIINKFLHSLIKRGVKGKIIIPNAVMAELENMANKGREEGFTGLEEIAKLHHLKKKFQIIVFFEGTRPNEMQIKFAKSGEIDALIREIARKNKATLVTADLVQAKTAQAYGIEVLFLRPKIKQEKPRRKFFGFWRRR